MPRRYYVYFLRVVTACYAVIRAPDIVYFLHYAIDAARGALMRARRAQQYSRATRRAALMFAVLQAMLMRCVRRMLTLAAPVDAAV